MEKNEENKNFLENCDSIIVEASKLLNQVKGVMKGHQQRLKANQREKQRRAEAEERVATRS